MSAAATGREWRQQAACAGQDTDDWFPRNKSASAALAVCSTCPVRAECLHDALTHETPNGIWGGLTIGERRAAPALPDSRPEALTVLRQFLARTAKPTTSPVERTQRPMSSSPAAPAPQPNTTQIDMDELLAWGEAHPDPDVQDQTARASAALIGLRKRHASDQELSAISTEAEHLEKRLAEIRAREAELAPKKPKKRKSTPLDYDSRAVRAWAGGADIDCPKVGRIPRKVLEAWRAAGSPTGGQS